MPNVQIKDVPEAAHAVLRRRAAGNGQSLQEYMLAMVMEQTGRPTLDEALANAASIATADVSIDDVNEILRADRDRR